MGERRVAFHAPFKPVDHPTPSGDRTMALLTDLGIIDLTVTAASLEDMFLREYQGTGR